MFRIGLPRYALLAFLVLLGALAAVCLASDDQAKDEESVLGLHSLRKLLISIPIPIGQGRCAGTFTREWIPCYISQYSMFSSLG